MHKLKRGISESTHTIYDKQTIRAMFQEVTLLVDGQYKKGYVPILTEIPPGSAIIYGEEIENVKK